MAGEDFTLPPVTYFQFRRRLPTLLTLSTFSHGFQRVQLCLKWNSVQLVLALQTARSSHATGTKHAHRTKTAMLMRFMTDLHKINWSDENWFPANSGYSPQGVLRLSR